MLQVLEVISPGKKIEACLHKETGCCGRPVGV